MAGATMKKVACITGASRGLGLALARELARRDWALIIDSRGKEALAQVAAELSRRTEVVALAGDVTDPLHRQSLLEAVRTAGGLDVLVNNASILGVSPQPRLLEFPMDAFEQLYRVNVFAPLALVQMLHAEFRKGGCVINITSDAGVEAYPGWGGYGSSKAAFEQLSAVLAAENASLRVYWVDPGDMRTQMQQEAYPGEDISDRPLPEESVPGLITLIEGSMKSGRYRARELAEQKAEAKVQES